MRFLLIILFTGMAVAVHAQELFVFSEPASNMASKSIGLRLNNYFIKEQDKGSTGYIMESQLMWGISKKIMFHGTLYNSNTSGRFISDGGSLYLKYRFYSEDEVHSHFRMAAFAKWAYNALPVVQTAIDLAGYNGGVEAGVIATKLMNKVALSAGTSFVHASGYDRDEFNYGDKRSNAVSYNLSVGKLLLPKEYISYNQVNLNAMMELLGQTNLYSGEAYLDMAPSVQLIFLSRMKVDIGYRFAMIKNLSRVTGNSFLLGLEYNFFNVYK